MDESFSPSDELQAKLKGSDPDVQHFVSALQAQLTKMAKKQAEHEVKHLEQQARIKQLEEEVKTRVDFFKLPLEDVQHLREHLIEKYGSDLLEEDEGEDGYMPN